VKRSDELDKNDLERKQYGGQYRQTRTWLIKRKGTLIPETRFCETIAWFSNMTLLA